MPIISVASNNENQNLMMYNIYGRGTQAGSQPVSASKIQNTIENGVMEEGLVSNVFDSGNFTGNNTNNANIGRMISDKIVQNLNSGIFSGTIEIPGDPFYLFDSVVQPFVYVIRITILRPELNEKNGKNFNTKSYLSGDYLIKKINHTLGQEGFTTILEISKFPNTEVDRSFVEAQESVEGEN